METFLNFIQKIFLFEKEPQKVGLSQFKEQTEVKKQAPSIKNKDIMKRFIFSAIALMVVTTACTESGLIDAPQFYGSRIAFDTYIGKAPITKAESVDLSYLESNASGGARVYAFMCETGNRDLNTIDFSSAYMDGRIKNVAPTTYKADGSIDSYGKWQSVKGAGE